MFPIAHAYLLQRIYTGATPEQFLGCVWPDMLFRGPLTHHQTHRNGLALLRYAHESAPALVPFTLAALSHGTEPHGFDWYSDESYDPDASKGFAFERAKPFVERVVAATKIDPAMGLWKAHNFVEMSFEATLGRQYPQLGQQISRACGDKAMVKMITDALAQHFQQPATDLARNIHEFPTTVALENISSLHLAEKYSVQLQIKHDIAHANIPAMAAIIDDIITIIAGEHDIFLEYCITHVRSMLNASEPHSLPPQQRKG